MYRFLLALAIVVMLIGAAIIGYGVYVAITPEPALCQGNGAGCGAPSNTPRD